MKKFIHAAVFVSSLGALAPLAPAQAANAAAQAAHATAHVPVPVVPPPAASAVAAGVAANAAAASTAAHAGSNASAAVPKAPLVPPAASPASTHAAAQSAVAGSIPASANAGGGGAASSTAAGHPVGAGASAHAATNGTTQTGSIALNPGQTMLTIRDTTFASRNTLATEIGARVDASNRAVAILEARADAAADHSRSALAKALVEVRAREKDLRTSLRATVKETDESSWGSVQSGLAKTYGDYAKAVADAEAAAQVEVTTDK